MGAFRIHASMNDVDIETLISEINQVQATLRSSRMVVCSTPGEFKEALGLGLEIAVRDTDIFNTRLGPLHRLSHEQILHLSRTYDNTLRQKWGMDVANLVLDIHWTWRMLLPGYRKKILTFLTNLGSHRLFLILDHEMPKRVRSYPWETLQCITPNIFFQAGKGKHLIKAHQRISEVGVSKFMLVSQDKHTWDAHEVLGTRGLNALMSGDK
jgi:hypothetical protein